MIQVETMCRGHDDVAGYKQFKTKEYGFAHSFSVFAVKPVDFSVCPGPVQKKSRGQQYTSNYHGYSGHFHGQSRVVHDIKK